ncbi:hypothetical protein H6P81_000765 [Aristolochia fimbriata]|uniref:Response regulatory domain-containing protein n=1 Tax=Aristolochia fimbriata TaxID=158543 RepID=A0AAV7F909_ARIFI|nr:hypothetical protein H6P81_000765 [Aristolochia fimbriata]
MEGDQSLASSSLFYPLGIPPGIRVMLVDDDCNYLTMVKKLLTILRYKVKIFASANHAWQEAHKKNSKIDIFMIDVQLPGSSGFDLVDRIKNKWSDAPVIMCSLNAETEVLRRASIKDGCFYMTKPATVDNLKNLWEYVEWRNKGKEIIRENNVPDDGNRSRALQRGTDEETKGESSSTMEKKAFFYSNVPLLRRFYWAVNQLGFPRAIPSEVLEMMDVPELTKQNVSCRLQKYRQFLKKVHKEISLYTKKYHPHMHPPFLKDFDPEEQTPEPFDASQDINTAMISQSLPMTTTFDNVYNSSREFDFRSNNNSEWRTNIGPDPHCTGSSIYGTGNAPSGMTTASSGLGNKYSNLYFSGAPYDETGSAFGVINSMSLVPVSGTSVGTDKGVPVPGSTYTLQSTPGVQPQNSPSSFTFEPSGVPDLITEDEAAKLDDILSSGDIFDLLN